MNITNISSTIKSTFGINKNSNNPKIDLTSKDTISFSGSASTKKKIADFKKLKPNEYGNQNLNDVVKVLDYFGYKQTKDNKKLVFIGPYGQTVTLSHGQKVPSSFVGHFVTALNRADDFNGELIILGHQMSEAEKEEWLRKIETRKPNKDQINEYALELQKEIKPTETTKDVKTTKEEELREEQRIILVIAQSTSPREKEAFKNVSEEFEKLKKEIEQLQISDFDEDLKVIETEIKEKEKTIHEKEKKLNHYNRKIANELLTEEELDELEEYPKKEITFEDTKSKINAIKETLSKNQEAIRTALTTKLEETTYTLYELGYKIDGIKEELKKYPNVQDKVADLLELLEETDNKRLATVQKLDTFRRIKLNKVSNNVVSTTMERVQEINDTEVKSITDSVDTIVTLIETEIKQNDSNTDLGKEPIVPMETAEEKTDFPPTQPTNVSKPKKEPETIEVIDTTDTVDDINKANETNEIDNIESNTTSVTRLPMQEDTPIKLTEVKNELAAKLAFLPLENVTKAVAKILDRLMKENDFTPLEKSPESIKFYINNIVNKASQTNDFRRINNAIRFALLNEVYNASENKNGEIFSLTPDETNELIDKILNYENDISLQHNEKEVKITLNKIIDLKSVNEIFAEYNENLQHISPETGDAIMTELTKYKPNISEKEKHNVFLQTGAEGRYLELLIDEKAPSELKKEILESFWKNYDKNFKTQFTDEIIEEFNKNQEEESEETKLQRKLNTIKSQNWTIF